MSIFDSLGPQQLNPMQAMQQLRQNPVATLRQRGINVPDGMTDPQRIIQHLVQSGQVSSARLQQVMQMVGRR